MPSLKELREKAGQTVDEMKRLRDEYNKRKDEGKQGADLWPGDTEKRWKELNDLHGSLAKQIEEEKRSDELSQRIAELEKQHGESRAGDRRQDPDDEFGGGKPGQDDFDPKQFRSQEDFREQRDNALACWAVRGHCSEERLKAAKQFGIDPKSNELRIDLYPTRTVRRLQSEIRRLHPDLVEERALSAHTGTKAGFTIGSTLVGALELNMLAYGSVEQVAQVMVTDTGEDLHWPTADDTNNEGRMIGENPSSPTETEPTFARVTFGAHEFSSDLVKVPVRLIEDSPVDFAGELGRMLGERIGRAKNRKFTSGTGASQPKGIVTAASLGVTAASATAIASEELIKLFHSVDPAYRSGASFMCHDIVVQAMRLLKDGENRFLWQSGLQDGVPDRLLGLPISINQHMDSAVATTNKTLLFGQLSKYKVRRVRQVVILRLDERHAEERQVSFIAFERADGNLLDAGTAPVKYLQQA